MKPALVALVLAGRAAVASATVGYDEAIEVAVRTNERAGIDAATAAAARARVDEARSFFFPSVFVAGTYTRRANEAVRDIGDGETAVVQALNAVGASANLTLSVFDARSIPLYRQAKLESESVAKGTANDVRLLTFEVGDAYLLTLGAQQVVEAALRRLELAQHTLDDARARFQAQLVRSNDVTKAELGLATAEQAVTQSRSDLATAVLQLGFLVGQPLAAPLAEPAALLDAAAGAPAPAGQLVAEARERRLDVSADRLHAGALHEFAREPLMRFVPSLGLAAQVRATNEAGIVNNHTDWFAGLTLTWRIYDGGLATSERAERESLARAADLQTDLLVRSVATDVDRALVGLANGQAQVKLAADALAAAQKNEREVNALYRQGLASALDEADANAQLFDAEVSAIRARYTLALAYLDLRAALGLDARSRSTP